MNRLLVVVLLLAAVPAARADMLTGQMIINSKDAKVLVLKTAAGLAALAYGPDMKARGIESVDGLQTCDRVDAEVAPAGPNRVISTVSLQKRADGATCDLPPAPTAPVDDLYQALSHKSAFVVDVRTVEEFAQAHFEGAVNIPLTEIEARRGELPKELPILVYCASGRRSGIAVLLLKQKGIAAKNIRGKFVVKDGKPQIIE